MLCVVYFFLLMLICCAGYGKSYFNKQELYWIKKFRTWLYSM